MTTTYDAERAARRAHVLMSGEVGAEQVDGLTGLAAAERMPVVRASEGAK